MVEEKEKEDEVESVTSSCSHRVVFVDLPPLVIELTRSELRGRSIAKVSPEDVLTSISCEYRELSRGLYGFGLDSVAY
ncbi:hypothetical protein G5I_13149 [Acromyrmex echinatior]|uniref:Uncharacterized protein n=1 Tax=Acromyrmex echinatior TaxID=103372 RepID=F4X490_ACREC|nr:hypothetical protein G5I_13149 [Acromyrmex echinatior]